MEGRPSSAHVLRELPLVQQALLFEAPEDTPTENLLDDIAVRDIVIELEIPQPNIAGAVEFLAFVPDQRGRRMLLAVRIADAE